MNRRTVVKALGLTLLGLSMRPFGALAALRPASGPLGAGDLVRTLRHRGSAARIGQAYLAEHAGEHDLGHLVEALVQSLDDRSSDRTRLRRALNRRIQADFADGETVRVQGWVLSRTEARLSAVTALHAASA